MSDKRFRRGGWGLRSLGRLHISKFYWMWPTDDRSKRETISQVLSSEEWKKSNKIEKRRTQGIGIFVGVVCIGHGYFPFEPSFQQLLPEAMVENAKRISSQLVSYCMQREENRTSIWWFPLSWCIRWPITPILHFSLIAWFYVTLSTQTHSKFPESLTKNMFST